MHQDFMIEYANSFNSFIDSCCPNFIKTKQHQKESEKQFVSFEQAQCTGRHERMRISIYSRITVLLKVHYRFLFFPHEFQMKLKGLAQGSNISICRHLTNSIAIKGLVCPGEDSPRNLTWSRYDLNQLLHRIPSHHKCGNG